MGEYSKLDSVKKMGTRGKKINAIRLNIKINLQKLVDYVDMNCQQVCKISRKKLTQNENIPKSFRGRATFLKHPVDVVCPISVAAESSCGAGRRNKTKRNKRDKLDSSSARPVRDLLGRVRKHDRFDRTLAYNPILQRTHLI